MPLQNQFADAAKAGDFYQIITLAQTNGQAGALSEATHIARRTLRGMRVGSITPSKSQQEKICAFALGITA